MSKNYLQILELAASLSREECIMLIKDISTALVEVEETVAIPDEIAKEMLKSVLATRAKIRSGEMKTHSIEEAKARFNASK